LSSNSFIFNKDLCESFSLCQIESVFNLGNHQ
jgi:hypothetical protein